MKNKLLNKGFVICGACLLLSTLWSAAAFAKTNGTVTADTLNVRSGPSEDAKIIGQVTYGSQIELRDSTEDGWVQIAFDNPEAYVCADYVALEGEELTSGSSASQTEVLNPYNGTVMGPSGKETYYNLDMSGIVSIMRSMGNNDEYWIREDGVKMLGDYIMCAANLDVHPRGSYVESSLGTCIVCDTGGFAAYNPYQLDIAVNW